jgi:signal transduction histidine kinase
VIATVVSGLLLAVLSAVSYGVLARLLDADVSTRLTELTEGLHGYLRFEGGQPRVVFNAEDGDQAAFVEEATRYYQVYDAGTGELLFQSDSLVQLGLTLTREEVEAFRREPRSFDITTAYGRLRMSNSVIGATGRIYLLQVGVRLSTTDAALGRYRDLLLWLALPSLLVAVLAGWWLSGFALTPLSRLAMAAREIDVGTLERRLPTRPVDDELEDVTRAFNDTLSRLEQSVGEMRQFSAALAHELRTPLAALRGEIELVLRTPGNAEALQRSLASQIEEIDRLKRLIDHILTLARAESGQIPLTFTQVDLSALGSSLVEQLEPVAHARSIELRCNAEASVLALGDAACCSESSSTCWTTRSSSRGKVDGSSCASRAMATARGWKSSIRGLGCRPR